MYITCKDSEEAQNIGRILLEEKLVACVNILPGIQSMYWWQGQINTDNESVLIAKTSSKYVEELISAVKAAHSYDVPCIECLPVKEGNPEYLQWLTDSLSTDK